MRTKIFKMFLFVIVLVLFAGCKRHNKSLIHLIDNEIVKKDISEILKENKIGKDEKVKVLNLGATENVSYHLIQINDKEEVHSHPDNDLVVFVKYGKGTFFIGEKSFDVGGGSVLVVPKGVKHYYVNNCKCGSAVIAVFSPPLIKD